MKTMPVSMFKAHALQALARVARTKERLLITKRGKPLAEVVPCQEPATKPVPGQLAGYLVFEKDIVSPLGPEMWEASR